MQCLFCYAFRVTNKRKETTMLTKEQFDSLRVGDRLILDVEPLMEVSQRYAEVDPQRLFRAEPNLDYWKIDGRWALGEYGPWNETYEILMSSGDEVVVTYVGTDIVCALELRGDDEELPAISIALGEGLPFVTLVEEEACAALTLA